MDKAPNFNIETVSFVPTKVSGFFQLMKPRVMSLVIFTGFAGIYLAPGDLHPILAFISLLAIAAGAGASGAINQWYDSDIDAIMKRTSGRPIPSGEVKPEEALAFGVTISIISVLILSLSANFLAGKGLVKALEQRASTILKVAKAIINKQNSFLENGVMGIKPLRLKDIAEELDIHESTVSRITNSKVICTPRGTFDLKFFFSKSLNVITNDDGLSSKVVKEKIYQLINNEVKVLSDNKLSQILKKEGINVARRTVTKYREEMTVPPSHQRKRLKQLVV